MHSNALRRLKLETDLRRGLERGELLVYYQPIISLKSGKIKGFEALSRWKHPDGMISPADFIPIFSRRNSPHDSPFESRAVARGLRAALRVAISARL